MKLTLLIRTGLVTVTMLSGGAALSSCSSGDTPLASGGGAAGSGSAQAGTQGGPLGSSGASTVGQGGGVNGTSGSGTLPQGGASGGSGTSGSTSGEPCTDVPPNNGDTCAHAVEYGWCSESWIGQSCRMSCGKCSSGGAGTGSGNSAGTSSGGSGNGSGGYTGAYGGGGGQPPAIEGGSQGWATRYWDCCKPACGWKGNVPGGSTPVHSCNASDQSLGSNFDAKNACEGDKNGAYMCHDFGPWPVSSTLAYGYAAVNRGGDYCGKCYQLQFTGTSHSAQNDPGSQSLKDKTMIVQAINTGGVDGTQFDLLIPGGGVGDFDACTSQWGTSDLGERYGGFYLACQKQNGFDYQKSKACAEQKCQSVFKDKPDLLRGCDFFIDWMGAPDNPNLVYKEVPCPEALTQVSGLKR